MNDYSFEDMTLGLSESFEVELTNEMMDAFLSASGDRNPLHVDESFAKERGFPGRVAYGMLTSSLYSRLCGVYLPGRRCLLQSVEVKMLAPAFVGDALMVTGRVSDVHDSVRMVRIRAEIRNQDGLRISKALIQVGFTG